LLQIGNVIEAAFVGAVLAVAAITMGLENRLGLFGQLLW
jgi:hypothetical protein